MGKKSWATEEQLTWFEKLIPKFVQAQEDKATGIFFEDAFDKWHKNWLTAAPTEEEISECKGSIEKALASKKKAVNTVSLCCCC